MRIYIEVHPTGIMDVNYHNHYATNCTIGTIVNFAAAMINMFNEYDQYVFLLEIIWYGDWNEQIYIPEQGQKLFIYPDT